jgi:hypothetical protein
MPSSLQHPCRQDVAGEECFGETLNSSLSILMALKTAMLLLG